jgi:hypothetical protein
VCAGALTNATKVDSQNSEAGVVQRSGGTKDNFIVHRAATEWMWM